MIQARIHQGRVEPQEAIPPEWEGKRVKIVPLSPDESLSDLDECLAALHALGPMEFEPGERERMAEALVELDRISKSDLRTIVGSQP